MIQIRPTTLSGYVASTALVGLALGVRYLLALTVAGVVPYALLFPVITVVTWAFGLGPALYTLGLSAVATLFFFDDWQSSYSAIAVNTVIFLFSGLIVLAVAHRLRSTLRKLQRTEQRLAVAHEIGRAGEWEWNLKKNRLAWSESQHRLFGTDPQTFTPDTASFVAMIHPDDVTRCQAELDEILARGGRFEQEFRIVRPDGVAIWIASRGEVLERNGKAERIVGFNIDVTERHEMERAARLATREREEAQARLDVALQVADIGVWEFDPSSGQITASPAMNRMFGMAGEGYSVQPINTYMALIHPDDQEKVRERLEEALRENQPFVVDYRIVTAENTTRWIVSRGGLASRDGNACLVGAMIDLTERRQMEEKLNRAVEQVEMLLQEMNHRIKNNLQMVSSLLTLQSDSAQDPEVKEHLTSACERVATIAAMHTALYQNNTIGIINFSDYLNELGVRLRALITGAPAIKLTLNSPTVYLDADKAVPLGLIVNELATNAIKHAFHDRDEGTIEINFSEQEGVYTLRVCDDGHGMDPQRFEKTTSMGMRLMKALSHQLNAQVNIDTSGGTIVTLTFTRA